LENRISFVLFDKFRICRAFYNCAFPLDCFVLDPFLLAHKANIELSRRCSFGRDKTGTFTRRGINIACVIKDSSVF